MNKRKGFKRLALGIGIPYFGIWGIIAYTSEQSLRTYHAIFNEAFGKHDQDAMTAAIAGEVNAQNMSDLAFVWGILVPLALHIVGAISYWVYRGFKPKVRGTSDA